MTSAAEPQTCPTHPVSLCRQPWNNHLLVLPVITSSGFLDANRFPDLPSAGLNFNRVHACQGELQ